MKMQGVQDVAKASDTENIVYQNLKDAGCDRELTERCMSFVKKGNIGGMLPILTNYRVSLLNTVRTVQNQIDCLDYLIYKLQRGTI